MKNRNIKKLTAFLLSGAMLATGLAGAMPALHASAAATEQVTTSNGLKYRYIVKDSTSCILKRVSDANSDWALTTKSSLTIPDKIPGTNYTIKELGHENQAIVHSNSTSQTRVTSITLPKQVEKINNQALLDTEVPKLTNLYVNLDKVKNCAESAFGSNCYIQNLYTYDTSMGSYANTGTVTNFEKYYGVVNAQYTALAGDLFRINSSALDGKLTFLNAISVSPYSKKVAFEYAKKIAQTNGFSSTSVSKQLKLQMIYDYLVSHERYSAIYDTAGNRMATMSGSALSALALNSGVCGSFAHAFEMLCRASGFNITDNPATSEVVCVGTPGHALNAVRLSASDGYYIIDCTAGHNVPVFMRTKGYQTTQFTNMYCYGNNTTISQVNSNALPFSASMLSGNEFLSGNSFVKIINNAGNNLKVEIYDKNNTSRKFVNYNAVIKPAVGSTCTLSQIADMGTLPQYVSSYCYFAVRIGGVVIDPGKNTQTITTGGRQYRVVFETRDFGNGQQQVCSNANYYFLSITPV